MGDFKNTVVPPAGKGIKAKETEATGVEAKKIEADGRKAGERKVKVFRSGVDPANRDLEISITVNTAVNKKRFLPGAVVFLSPSDIGALNDSIDEAQITIPPESGVYAAGGAMSIALAQKNYPGMEVFRDFSTGLIVAKQMTPNYIVQYLD